jgi:hypothetical protein
VVTASAAAARQKRWPVAASWAVGIESNRLCVLFLNSSYMRVARLSFPTASRHCLSQPCQARD